LSGFTLLEMTVALALVALMSIIIIEGLRFSERVWTQVVRTDDANWNVFVAHRFLRDVLEPLFPFKPERANGAAFGLEGTASEASFSASTSPFKGVGALNRYHVFLAADQSNSPRKNVLITWHVDRDGRTEHSTAGERQEVLLENVERIEWSYLDAPCNAPATWRDEWAGRHELPALVRLRVIFPKGDSRRWPDLIVTPRVTDDPMFSLYDPGTEPSCGGAR
jgi:general secretion pathway protein J